MAMRDAVTLMTERLVLREPRTGDDLELCAYYARNAERFERFEPPRSTDPAEHARSIARLRADADRIGRPTTFFVFERRAPEALAGVVSLDGFSAVPPSAMIAYSIDAPCEGRGLASEAVALVVAYAFAEHGLEVINAFYDPANVRSERLLLHVGFTLAGGAPVVPGFQHLMRSSAAATISRR